MNMQTHFLPAVVLSLLLLPLSSQAAPGLTNCFSGPQDYTVNYIQELSDAENQPGNRIDPTQDHLLGSGGPLIAANCECPGNMTSSSRVFERDYAGSPLSAGSSGYGYLTDAIDIDIQGYSDASNSSDGTGLNGIPIDIYPTPIGSMQKGGADYITESTADVCNDATRPAGISAPKRYFKWNVISAQFYIKKPILGEEVIPRQIVVQNYACLYISSSTCNSPLNAQHVANIWLGGTLSAPLNCTINAGSTINVDLGTVNTTSFPVKDQPPENYTLRDVNIAYHCSDPAISNNGKIKLTLTADQGTSADSGGVIARTLDRDDVGIRMYDTSNKSVLLDGSFEFPVTLDEQGNGIIQMKAAPVSTKEGKPSPGEFQADVTVKMDIR